MTELLKRGVFRAPYLLGGAPVLVAIDACGNCIKVARLTSKTDASAVTGSLRSLLDEHEAKLERRNATREQRTLTIVPGGICGGSSPESTGGPRPFVLI